MKSLFVRFLNITLQWLIVPASFSDSRNITNMDNKVSISVPLFAQKQAN